MRNLYALLPIAGRLAIALLLVLSGFNGFPQSTTLISPTGDGGFETGTTFAANGWTVVNGATNQWFVGNAGSATVPSAGTRAAYVSESATGATYTYNITASSVVYFYRDITFPAGQTEINLSFKWKAGGESTWDWLAVWSAPTTVTPVFNSPTAGSSSFNNIPTTYPGATLHGTPPYNLQGAAFQTVNLCLPASYAGTTRRIVFMWSNDGSGGVTPPGTIDEISLTSATPAPPAAQPTSLTLSPISTSQVNGSFTAAPGSPSYLVVAYPSGATPVNPVNGTSYTAGSTLGTGTVISSGNTTSFNATGLSGSTTYDFYVYSFNTSTCSGNQYLAASPLMATASTNACGGLAGGTYAVGPTGAYPNLTAAAAALAAGITGPVIFELQSTYSSGGETFPIVFPNNACVGPVNQVTVRPAAGAAGLAISGDNAVAILDINGGDYITIDGRAGGTGTARQLTIVNTNTTGVAVRFTNDAKNNVLRYLDIQGSSNVTPTTATLAGVVYFAGAGADANGNDNNTIANSIIHASPSGRPAVGIYAFGTSTSVATYNDNITVTDCEIFDIFKAGAASTAIKVDAGNNAWTITNNHIYQTSPVAYTAAATHRGIWVTPNTGSINNTASGFTINGNYIGGSGASLAAPAYTMSGAFNYAFNGMDISVGLGAASSVQNNHVGNISMTSSATATTAFVGINIANGNVNVGTVSGNTIGSLTANGDIIFTTAGSAGGVMGIRVGGGGTVNIANNKVGGIDLSGTGAAITTNFNGINVAGGTTITVTNNTIGSTDLANNINMLTPSTTAGVMNGINVSGGTTTTVNNNIVANINSNTAYTGTGTTSVRGIIATTSATSINNNIVKNLSSSSASTATGANGAVVGIVMSSTNVAGASVTGNTIDSLVLTSTSATAAITATGLFYSGTATVTNNIAKNFIHSFDVMNANSNVLITGIDNAAGANNYVNNMIRLGIKPDGTDLTNENTIRGISSNSTGATNIYFNTIYIGGNNVGSVVKNTYAFIRTSTSGTYNIMNNILVNNRSNAGSGAGGKHYVFVFTNPASGSATAGVTINSNLYQYTGTDGAFVGYTGTTPPADVTTYTSGWLAGDAVSVVGNPQLINPAAPISAVNLHIHPTNPTPVEGGGIAIGTVTDDFDGQVRSGLTPTDIGADAGNFVLLDLTPPLITYTALGNNICLENPAISATITDAGGVNTAAGTAPRLWFKKDSENDVLAATNNSAGNGWKYVQASNTTSPFTFTMDYSLLSSPIVRGDSITYFIAAQDLAPTPNVAVNMATLGAVPSSVALTTPGVFPTSGVIRGFRLLDNPVVIKADKTALCQSGIVVLSLDNSDVTGGTLQWQSSPAGTNTWTDIPAAITVPYTTATLTASTDFRLVVKCNGVQIPLSPSNVISVTVTNPQVTSTTPGTRCGVGTVNLSATGNGTGLNWYASATGGVSLGTGSPFTTPSISNTTTYYVAANDGGTTAYVGKTAIHSSAGTGGGLTTYMNFDAQSDFVLKTVDIYPYAATAGLAGTVTIELRTATGTPIMSKVVNVTTANSTAGPAQTVTLDFPITGGASYRLGVNAWTGATNLYRDDAALTTVTYPYTIPGVVSITGPSTAGYYYFFYNWQVSSGCEGTRVPVVATVNTPPTLTVTASKTICNDAVHSLAVTSPVGDFNSYVWTPETDLYTDAAGTIPYTPGASATQLYARSSTPSATTYTLTASNTTTQCVNSVTSTVTVMPAPTLLASPSEICGSGSAALSLSPSTGYGAAQFQWQSSPDGIAPYTDIAGANSAGYTTPVLTQSGFYKLVVKDQGGTSCNYSLQASVNVTNPQITGSTPASRCGPGSVNLSATAPGFDVVWYAGASGGNALSTGNLFSTPLISSTTTYYAAAATPGAGTYAVGAGASTSATYSNPFYSLWSNAHNQHLITAGELSAAGLVAGNISAMGIDITAAGTLPMLDLSIKIGHTSASDMTNYATDPLQTVYTSPSLMPTVGLNMINFSTPFTWDGVSNIVIEICHGNPSSTATMSRTALVDPTSYVSSIHTHKTSSTTGSVQCADVTTNKTTYSVRPKFTFVSGCVGTRTAVTATITTPPAISSVTATPASVCDGQSTTLQVSSSNAGYTYVWTPGGTGASISVTPATTTKFYVDATDNSGGAFAGCTNRDSVTVTVNPIPSAISINPSSNTVCPGSSAIQLTASGGTLESAMVFGTQANTNAASTTATGYPSPFTNYYGGSRHQFIILASELTAAGFTGGSAISSINFPVVSVGSTVTGLQDFKVKIGHTASSTIAAFIAGLATHYGPSTFVPTVGYNNQIDFTTPFVWNGTDNLVIETTFSNGNTGGTTDLVAMYNSPTPFQSTIVYRVDGATAAAVEAGTTVNFSYNARPDFTLNGSKATTITWSPQAGLYTNALATTPYTGGNTSVVYALPSATTVYTATGMSAANCSSSGNVTVTYNTSATNSALAGIAGGASVCASYNVAVSNNYFNNCELIATIVPGGALPVSGNINACVKIESGVPTDASGKPYVARHFDILPATNATTATSTITLYFQPIEFSSYNAGNGSFPDLPTGAADAAGIANLRVTQFNSTTSGGLAGYTVGSGSMINPADADIVFEPAANRWKVTFAATGSGGFYVHTGNFILPVSGLEFTGEQAGSINRLSWKTATETNNKGFELQRSADGINFSALAFIGSKAENGNSTSLLSYTYNDPRPISGNNYYRLKQVDKDGKFTYSNVVLLSRKVADITLSSVYPNPAERELNLVITSPRIEKVTIIVTDLTGKVIMQHATQLVSGENLQKLNVQGLAAGSYLVKAVCANSCETAIHRFIKQ